MCVVERRGRVQVQIRQPAHTIASVNQFLVRRGGPALFGFVAREQARIADRERSRRGHSIEIGGIVDLLGNLIGNLRGFRLGLLELDLILELRPDFGQRPRRSGALVDRLDDVEPER